MKRGTSVLCRWLLCGVFGVLPGMASATPPTPAQRAVLDGLLGIDSLADAFTTKAMGLIPRYATLTDDERSCVFAAARPGWRRAWSDAMAQVAGSGETIDALQHFAATSAGAKYFDAMGRLYLAMVQGTEPPSFEAMLAGFDAGERKDMRDFAASPAFAAFPGELSSAPGLTEAEVATFDAQSRQQCHVILFDAP